MLELHAGTDALEVWAAGEPVCRYLFDPGRPKPYLASLRLPGGPELLCDAPPDHPHHHGLWFGHGRVEAAGTLHDLWLERPGCGRIVQEGLELWPDGWSAEARWLAADGSQLARERRTFRLAVAPDRLTLHIAYTLEGTGVRLRGTNEAGLPLVRPAPWIAATGGGRARDSAGRTGEREIFGRPALWVDYAGVWDGEIFGLALLDDPANLGRPTRWFVRDYGPFGPNDGLFDHHPRELPLRVRYTLVAHRGEFRP
jgi:hypothetical protein